MENNNIQNTSTAIGWLEKILEMAKKYSFFNWLEAFLVIFITGVMIICFANPDKVLDFFIEGAKEKHTELMEYRQQNAVKVQSIADKLLYTYGASRCLILETHNSTDNTNGLPFLKASSTFETVNDGVFPISTQYQNTTLSLVPFADYLYEHKVWIGKTEDMENIDRSLSYRMRSNNAEYMATTSIRNSKGIVGFLFLTFNTKEPELDMERLRDDLEDSAWDIALLLEMIPTK